MLAIVTDSTAALTEKEARTLGVRIVPMPYALDGVRQLEAPSGQNGVYGPRISAARLRSTEPPSPASYLSTFDELTRRGFEVLCITISSRLSGAYRSARQAQKECASGSVLVFDSQTTAAGMEFLIRRARNLANTGATLAQIGEQLEASRDQQGIAFSVQDMEALRRSGRLGLIRQSVGTILNRRPILTLAGGAIVSQGTARGTQSQAEVLVDQLPRTGVREAVLVCFGGSTENVGTLVRTIRARFPSLPVRVKDGGPILSIHLGVGTVAVAWDLETQD